MPEQINQPANQNGHAAVKVGAQNHRYIIDQNIARNTAANGSHKSQRNNTEQIKLQGHTDLCAGNAERCQTDGIGNNKSSGQIGATITLHPYQPCDGKRGKHNNQRISLQKHLRNPANQAIAYHAAANSRQ